MPRAIDDFELDYGGRNEDGEIVYRVTGILNARDPRARKLVEQTVSMTAFELLGYDEFQTMLLAHMGRGFDRLNVSTATVDPPQKNEWIDYVVSRVERINSPLPPMPPVDEEDDD